MKHEFFKAKAPFKFSRKVYFEKRSPIVQTSFLARLTSKQLRVAEAWYQEIGTAELCLTQRMKEANEKLLGGKTTERKLKEYERSLRDGHMRKLDKLL